MTQVRPLRSDTKVPLLCEQLRELALKAPPDTRLPSVSELCSLFATSRATLNDALQQAEALNIVYRKSGSGIFVSPELHRKHIYAIFPSNVLTSSASPFWGTLCGLIMQRLQIREETNNETNHFFLRMPSQGKQVLPAEVISSIHSRQVHGILFVGHSFETIEWISMQNLPCVVFAGYGRWMVSMDKIAFTSLAVMHLQQQGCRRIALWVDNTPELSDDPSVFLHIQSFPSLLAARGLPFEPSLVRHCFDEQFAASVTPPARVTEQEQGYFLAQDVFGKADTLKPDGIVITNDLMTDGVLAAFQSLGIRVGKDVTIATHANVGSMMLFGHLPGMIVIEFDPAEIVDAMFVLLDTLMDGRQPQQAEVFVQPKIRQMHNRI